MRNILYMIGGSLCLLLFMTGCKSADGAMRKKRDAAIIRNKKYRQQPLYIFNHRFPHPVSSLFRGQRYYNFFNCFVLCIFALLKQKRNSYELVT